MKFMTREAIPPAIIGGVIAAVLAVMLQGFVASSLQAEEAMPAAELIILIAFGALAAGGFIAAYLTVSKAKERFGNAILAGFMSGIVSAAISIVLLVMATPLAQYTDAQQFQLFQELGTMIWLIALSMTMSGSMGGMLCAYILGFGKDDMWAVFKESFAFLRNELWALILVTASAVAVVGAALAADTLSSDETLAMIAMPALALVLLALLDFAYASVVLTAKTKKKESLTEAVSKAFTGLAKLFPACFIASIPLAALVFVEAWVMSVEALMNPTTSIILLLANVAAFAYMILISFLPHAVLLGKSRGIEAIAASARFVKDNLAASIVMYMAWMSITLIANIGIMVIDVAAALAGVDSTPVTSFAVLLFAFALLASAQTMFYKAVAE
ncbi:MAG: hypothetical protein JW834_02110 [Candidatus Diapherotrites archaeon]|nr:hypothetical protein [Candidatus Diapherotrites archaeon]